LKDREKDKIKSAVLRRVFNNRYCPVCKYRNKGGAKVSRDLQTG
jgi:hypothetical protein